MFKNPSKKKIAVCFALAALGAGTLAVQLNHSQRLSESITPTDILASPIRTDSLKRCIDIEKGHKVAETMSPIPQQWLDGKSISAADAGLTAEFLKTTAEKCSNYADRETHYSLYYNKLDLTDHLRFGLSLVAFCLGVAGGAKSISVALDKSISVALDKIKSGQKPSSPQNP